MAVQAFRRPAATAGNGSLEPQLPAFLERHPDVQLELDASDRQVDLAEDGFGPGVCRT